jgi:hypothetical protein
MYCRQHRVVVNDDLENEGNVPAPLNLPFGKLFFGFNISPYVPPPAPEEAPVPEVCNYFCIRQFNFFIAHTPSSPRLHSLERETHSVDDPPAPLPRVRARVRPQTRGRRRRQKKERRGAQGRGEAWARARQTGSVQHGRLVLLVRWG